MRPEIWFALFFLEREINDGQANYSPTLFTLGTQLRGHADSKMMEACTPLTETRSTSQLSQLISRSKHCYRYREDIPSLLALETAGQSIFHLRYSHQS